MKKLVKRNVIKFRMARSQDDIEQDILIKLITPSPSVGTTYLQRFDAEKNSMEGFLSRLIYNHFCRLYAKSRYNVEQAKSIDQDAAIQIVDNKSPHPGHFSPAVAKITRILQANHPTTSGVVYKKPLAVPVTIIRVIKATDKVLLEADQSILWRSTANIWQLMLDGFTQEEVASMMDVSKGWISKQVNKIRQTDEVAYWAIENGVDPDVDLQS